MKKKFSKILGVGLTVMLLASLLVAVAPVAADPAVLKWSKMPFPKAGSDGDYFRDADIDVVGPIAKAIDGSLFAYAEVDREPLLFKSDDDGRTWSKTKYDAAGGEEIVAIVPSSEDADIVYVADATTVWKSTDVASKTKWKKLAEDSLDDLLAVNNEDITSLDVGYADDDPFVFIGTATGTYRGDVYYLDEAAYGAVWEDLDIDIDATEGWDVYAVAVGPNFDDTSQIMAVVTDRTETWVTNNSGTPGAWFDDVELLESETNSVAIVGASRIGFPDDFDAEDAYELFVGVDDGDPAADNGGDVYRVLPKIAYDLDVDEDIASFDLVGVIGDTLQLAGEVGAAEVHRSVDDGDSWKDSKKEPSGTGPTYVLVADDFADSEEAWAATTSTATAGGAISFTVDGGNLWNQISLIDTDLDTVEDVTFGSDRFMVTTTDAGPSNNDVWKYDGEYWERVENKADIDLVQVSTEYATDDAVFLADSTSADIWRSTDGGGRFKKLATSPGESITGWLVIDDVTIIASDGSDIWKTKDRARTPWKDKGDGNLVSFALSPDFDDDETIIAGDDDGDVHRSTNAGDKWKKVSTATAVLPSDPTYVAFDPEYADNETIYGAAGDVVARWDGDEWEEILTTESIDTFEEASGLVCSADGTLYATDSEDPDGFEGMARTLAPTASTEAKCEWENVTKGKAPNLDSLQLTAGSNILWGLDESEAKVWTYEDTLTVSVSLTSPSDGASSGREGSASLSWAELDGAKEYQIKVNTRSDFKGVAQTVTSTVEVEATSTTGLADGKTYYWKVRVAEGEPVLSRWSEVWSFTTAMGAAEWTPFFIPGNVAPSAGATDVPLRPSFMWNPADWATGYEFELSTKPGTTARGYFVDVLIGMTGPNALGPGVTVWESDRDLDYSTTYFWHVKAISPTTSSEWATGVFTTIGPPPPPPPPPPEPLPPVVIPPAPAPITPGFIWAIVIIGAVLVIAVIVLIVRTRRVA